MNRSKNSLVLLCCLVLLLIGCGSHTLVGSKAQGEGAVVSFISSTTYTSALRIVTELGLQLTAPCMLASTNAQGKILFALPWSPIGRKDGFVTTHGIEASGQPGKQPTIVVTTELPALLIAMTPLAPSDWQTRLSDTVGVSKVDTRAVFNCPNISQPSPGTITSLPPQQAGTYIQVTFAPARESYDDALYTVSNLGFRLADPCYEQEQSQSTNWHPMGQERLFSSAHALVVATTAVTPTDWQQRLTQVSGVALVTAPYDMTC
jgi:hypothetical protein